MRIEKQWNRSKSNYYYSFVYYDNITKKRVRIAQTTIVKRYGRRITNKKEALKILAELEQEIDFANKRFRERKAWQQKYRSQKKLLKLYEEYQKVYKIAESTSANRLSFLKHYVLYFFLDVQKCEHPQEWAFHYDNFRIWLEKDALQIRSPDRKLSYQSKDHCIAALNDFLRFLTAKGKIEEVPCMDTPFFTRDFLIFWLKVKLQSCIRPICGTSVPGPDGICLLSPHQPNDLL